MSGTTKIEWADSTFNPWIGCTEVSTTCGGGGGCDGCYAKQSTPVRVLRAQGKETWGPGAPRQRTAASNWAKPQRWNEQPFVECMACGWRGESNDCSVVLNPSGFFPPIDSARVCPEGCGPQLKSTRRRVFCASLADVFDNDVDPAWRADLFRLIADTPNLDWLLLTKRIGNAASMIEEAVQAAHAGAGAPVWPWPNVWLGATVVNQREVDRDIPKLLTMPAAKRFVSVEPMLGAVDLRNLTLRDDWQVHDLDALTGRGGITLESGSGCATETAALDWVIAGGESGPHARPAHPDWFCSLRDQCKAAGVPFLFKQWGEWKPTTQMNRDEKFLTGCDVYGEDVYVRLDGTQHTTLKDDHEPYSVRDALTRRVRKGRAGRLLDGREHNGFPEVRS